MTNGKPIKIIKCEINGQVMPGLTEPSKLADDVLIDELAKALNIEDYKRCAKLKSEADRRGLEISNEDISEPAWQRFLKSQPKEWSITIGGSDE